jgi:hypothetical protein
MKKRKRLVDYRKKDFGTPELIRKRLANATYEPLDLCLKYELIERVQHRAGMRLRWLRSLRMGMASIRAHDYSDLGGKYSPRHNDQKMLTNKTIEYSESIRELKKVHAYQVVVNVCIHNISPKFLSKPLLADRALELKVLRMGLNSLASHYGYINQGHSKTRITTRILPFSNNWSKINS